MTERACPLPLARYPTVTLAHGAGGRLMNDLIARMFVAALDNPILRERADAARLPALAGPLALSTDTFVVSPLRFPGGSIGSLAVHGTVNDLAMVGARARYLTVGLVLEEGLAMETLWAEVLALAGAARACEVTVVAGDTKVVERGKGDALFINTTGLGERVGEPGAITAGDVILLSGDVGRHGMAVMAARDGLSFDEPLESDAASVAGPALALLAAGVRMRAMRDPTRGGLASALNELAEMAGAHVVVDETAVPVTPPVRAACELLGLDPFYVACEGRFVAFVHRDDERRALDVLRAHPVSAGAVSIGRVEATGTRPLVEGRNAYGTARVIDLLAGVALPRIC